MVCATPRRGCRDQGTYAVAAPELAAHQLGKSLDGDQEVPPRGVPGTGIIRDPATADQAMNMRVMTPTPTIP
jgi:hypothetical protein